MLYVHPRLPETDLIIYHIPLEVVFPFEVGLSLILYYFSISYFLNSLPINPDS